MAWHYAHCVAKHCGVVPLIHDKVHGLETLAVAISKQHTLASQSI